MEPRCRPQQSATCCQQLACWLLVVSLCSLCSLCSPCTPVPPLFYCLTLVLAKLKSIMLRALWASDIRPLACPQARDCRQMCPCTGQVLTLEAAEPTAAYLPLSYSGTGNVYIAVIALQDIAAGAEVTVDRGTVTYSKPVHDLVQAVLSRADRLQLGQGSKLTQTRHRQQLQQQRGAVQQHQQQTSFLLLQAEFESAIGAADMSFQQAANGKDASNRCRLTADILLKQLQAAMQTYKEGRCNSGAGVDVNGRAAAAGPAQHVATTNQSPAKQDIEAAAGTTSVPIPPVSAGLNVAGPAYAVKPPAAGAAGTRDCPQCQRLAAPLQLVLQKQLPQWQQ